MRLLFLLPILLLLVACENPVEPTNSDDDISIHITNVINTDGDDGCQINCGKDDTPDVDPDPNTPPILILPSTVTSVVGESVSVDVTASDADGDSVQIGFDPQSAPRDCSISPLGNNVSRISCVISSSSPDDSPFTVRVTGDDGNGGLVTGFFVWIVNEPEV